MKKNEVKKTTREVKKQGTPSQATLQSYIQNYSKEAIDQIVHTMRFSNNENLKFGAAKVIIDKSIADIKALELTGANGQPLQFTFRIDLAGGYIPPMGPIITAPTTSVEGPTPLQSLGVAQTSKKNDNSTDRVN